MGIVPELAPVLLLVGRVRRRMRGARAVKAALHGAIGALTLLLVALFLAKIHLFATPLLSALCWLVAALPLAAGLLAALRSIPVQAAAKRADDACGLADRLSSALEFGRLPEPTPFMRAQVRDASRHAAGLRPASAVPLRSPTRELRSLSCLAAALLGLALLHFPASGPAKPRVAARAQAQDLPLAHELARELAGKPGSDPRLAELAKEVDALLRKLETGELSRKEVFERLAELERKFVGVQAGDFEALKEKLRAMAEALAKEKPTRPLGQALAKNDLSAAQKELSELARKAAADKSQNAMSPQAAAQAAHALEDAAAQQQRKLVEEQRRLDAEQRSLAERQREFEKLERNQPEPKGSEERKRQLEQERQKLAQKQQSQKAQARQLERLSRSLQSGAQALAAGQRGQASESLQDAAGQMGQMADQIQKLSEGERVQMQLAELKEALRHAQKGDGQDEGKQKMKGFLARAKGLGEGKEPDPSESPGQGQGQGEGDPKLLLLGQGQGGMQVQLPGSAPGSAPEPQGGGESTGEGIGQGHDPNLLGKATQLPGKKRDAAVEGQQGAGPTRSEVIYGAADRGFATSTYRRVYGDYHQVVEEVMNREQVPLGKRYYIKRYFDLIKPRE